MSSLDSVSSATSNVWHSVCISHARRDQVFMGLLGSLMFLYSGIYKISCFSVHELTKVIDVTAVIVPCVTYDLPLQRIPFKAEWSYLASGRSTSCESRFGRPGRIGIFHGANVFTEIVCQGQQMALHLHLKLM